MKYGIEFEFFVSTIENTIVPAFLATTNLDGNPVVGELKTKVHDNIIDCVYELKKLIYLEEQELKKTNHYLLIKPEVNLTDDVLKSLRKNQTYVDKKEIEVLEELSIYSNGKTGKILKKGCYKASLQVNISENLTFNYLSYNRIDVEDKHKYESVNNSKSYSSIFNYVSVINKLDNAFKDEINKTQRVKGVYAIKNGDLGKRIEYRSLPNNISLDKLIEVLA